ncbi:MAG: macro domain-containing protein [Planctomycetes bacterium]|nr:macro domain-containing protein [Planctomycetota bacterium]
MKGCLIWVGARSLEVVQGNLLEERVHAIVNSAPTSLVGGKGLDKEVKSAGGLRLLDACRKVGTCAVGDAVFTPGFSLKAKFVIHAVPPLYEDGTKGEAELLRKTYRHVLQIAASNSLVSLSFPALGVGSNNFPVEVAAPIAFEEIIEHLFSKSSVRTVRYLLLRPERLKPHLDALREVAQKRSLRVIDL